jgi:hypothetical protein
MSLGRMMAGGTPGPRSREQDDFYPTPPEATRAFLAKEGGILRSWLAPGEAVWEVACGDGALAREIESFGLAAIGTDLVDRGYGTGGVDFLKLQRSEARSSVIVTNPPFTLAEDFIRQAMRLQTRYLALLLKATFWHTAGRLALWRDWRPASVYPLTWRVDFLNLGAPTMDVMWVVWRGTAGFAPTSYAPLTKAAGELFSGASI